MRPEIKTYGGHRFNFANPAESLKHITVEEIARALSKICRYTGHTQGFYSVAQHSVLVSRIVPEHLAWDALFHDAAEAFIGDMSSPVKKMFPEYKALELRIEAAMAPVYDLRHLGNPLIKRADLILLKTEQRDLMAVDAMCVEDKYGDAVDVSGIDPLHERILPMEHEDAFQLFMARYRLLSFKRDLAAVAPESLEMRMAP